MLHFSNGYALLDASKIRILLVTDGKITFDTSAELGLGTAIDSLRNTYQKLSFVDINVHLARRDGTASKVANPGAYEAEYLGFRFDQLEADGSLTISHYDQIWCFAYNPGNSVLDADVIDPIKAPTSDAELKELARFMNNGGSIFANGDHRLAGACMCSRMPRVSTMRGWTNPQHVPPFDGPNRLDTTQPASSGESNIGSGHPDPIPFDNQSDTVPKPIEWRPYSYSMGTGVIFGPHPILSLAARGAINILPDHGHEGRIFEDAEVDLSRTLTLAGEAVVEYPSTGAARPTPTVIAWATTTESPPYNLKEGPCPKRRFGIVGIYDGPKAGVGRVVVDSTWHHWANVNVTQLKAKRPEFFDLVETYWRNIALWCAKADQSQLLLTSAIWSTFSTGRAAQEFDPSVPTIALGRSATSLLARIVSLEMIGHWLADTLSASSKGKKLLAADSHARQRLDSVLRLSNTSIQELVIGSITRELWSIHESAVVDMWQGHGFVADLHGALSKGVEQGVIEIKSELSRQTESIAATKEAFSFQ